MPNPTLVEIQGRLHNQFKHAASTHLASTTDCGLNCESGHPIRISYVSPMYEEATGKMVRAKCDGGEFQVEW